MKRFRQGHFDPEFQPIFQPYTGNEVVSIDCETTSLNIKEAEVVSIAAVVVSDQRVHTSKCFDIRIQPPKSLTGDSIRIHQLRAKDLKGGLTLEQGLRDLLSFVGNRPLMGYYIHYDISILEKYTREMFGFGFPNKIIEVSRIYARKTQFLLGFGQQQDLRLDTILDRLNLPSFARHDALGDAVTVGLIYLRLCS